MKTKTIVGTVLSLPLPALLFMATVHHEGLWLALAIWGATLVIVGLFLVGTWLIVSDWA